MCIFFIFFLDRYSLNAWLQTNLCCDRFPSNVGVVYMFRNRLHISIRRNPRDPLSRLQCDPFYKCNNRNQSATLSVADMYRIAYWTTICHCSRLPELLSCNRLGTKFIRSMNSLFLYLFFLSKTKIFQYSVWIIINIFFF